MQVKSPSNSKSSVQKILDNVEDTLQGGVAKTFQFFKNHTPLAIKNAAQNFENKVFDWLKDLPFAKPIDEALQDKDFYEGIFLQAINDLKKKETNLFKIKLEKLQTMIGVNRISPFLYKRTLTALIHHENNLERKECVGDVLSHFQQKLEGQSEFTQACFENDLLIAMKENQTRSFVKTLLSYYKKLLHPVFYCYSIVKIKNFMEQLEVTESHFSQQQKYILLLKRKLQENLDAEKFAQLQVFAREIENKKTVKEASEKKPQSSGSFFWYCYSAAKDSLQFSNAGYWQNVVKVLCLLVSVSTAFDALRIPRNDLSRRFTLNQSDPDLHVNTDLVQTHDYPFVLPIQDGGFAVVFDCIAGSMGRDICVRRYSSASIPSDAAEFPINYGRAGTQTTAFCIDQNNEYLCVWSTWVAPDPHQVVLARLDRDFAPVAPEIRVYNNTNVAQKFPVIATNNNCSVVLWENYSQVYGRYLSLTNNFAGNYFPVNSQAITYHPGIASNGTTFLVVMHSSTAEPSGTTYGVTAQFATCKTVNTTVLTLNTKTSGNQKNPSVASTKQTFGVAWEDDDGYVYFQSLAGPQYTPNNIRVNLVTIATGPTTIGLSNGNYAVFYKVTSGSVVNINGREIRPDGFLIGNEIKISTNVATSNPVAASFPQGNTKNFAVGWMGKYGTDNTAIVARVFKANISTQVPTTQSVTTFLNSLTTNNPTTTNSLSTGNSALSTGDISTPATSDSSTTAYLTTLLSTTQQSLTQENDATTNAAAIQVKKSKSSSSTTVGIALGATFGGIALLGAVGGLLYKVCKREKKPDCKSLVDEILSRLDMPDVGNEDFQQRLKNWVEDLVLSLQEKYDFDLSIIDEISRQEYGEKIARLLKTKYFLQDGAQTDINFIQATRDLDKISTGLYDFREGKKDSLVLV